MLPHSATAKKIWRSRSLDAAARLGIGIVGYRQENTMNLPRRRFLHLAAGTAALSAVLALLLSGSGAWSQATRTVKIVVPVPPGGGIDFLTRLLAEQIGRTQDLTIVIESRPGAGGRIAIEAVSRLAPDSTTLVMTSPSFVIDPHVRKVNYHPLTSFEPICKLVETP